MAAIPILVPGEESTTFLWGDSDHYVELLPRPRTSIRERIELPMADPQHVRVDQVTFASQTFGYVTIFCARDEVMRALGVVSAAAGAVLFLAWCAGKARFA